MRGGDEWSGSLFGYVDLEARGWRRIIGCAIRMIVNEALVPLAGDFSALRSRLGRRSIAPEKLLRALMLQVLYGVRSERMVIEQLGYNLLFRWFVGVAMQDDPWDHSTFSKNRDRLEGDIAAKVLRAVLAQPR